ncbi:uncharacterized protein MELLADRAFT_102622 [Melampsora larici-populina 98AG31]|uniref:Uncharacterized protein n=1 Tax=Melampsora larici-populina (strain 98AG31 / pathotype 3-4-7) TaxID=747676 RepID=F4R8V1_MELLP|nr:uncharacterized protein MELLADRAFT_102622 [Melampsora larici-populina 98AG31]EGG10873.1 hypothetical protein MELLADRAFT_102622 [Melampsora larici-populina 98AG31]
MNESGCKPAGREAAQTTVDHYDGQDIMILTPNGAKYIRGVCILQTIGTPENSSKDKPNQFEANTMKTINTHLSVLKDVISKQPIVITAEGLGYHGGVQIPRNQLSTLCLLRTALRTMVDGRPNLLFDRMKPDEMPKFQDMSMRELADWRLGVLIQTPEAGVHFNRVFNLKRTQEGFSHVSYPVPFTINMSNDIDEMIISSEYDHKFILRCISLAEEAAIHNRSKLAPSLSELHGIYLWDTRKWASTFPDAVGNVGTHDGVQSSLSESGHLEKHLLKIHTLSEGQVNHQYKHPRTAKSVSNFNILPAIRQSANVVMGTAVSRSFAAYLLIRYEAVEVG